MNLQPNQTARVLPGGVRVIETRYGRSSITYLVEGPEAGVKAYVERLYRDYPPEGYGTTTVSVPLGTADDDYERSTMVKRAWSCD